MLQFTDNMKLLFKKTSFAVLTAALVSFCGATVYSMNNDPACNSHPQDPYSPSLRMSKGRYQGQCMDTSGKRAVQVLEERGNDEMTVANFRQNGRFYTAVIPLQQIEKISYVIVDLNPHPINFLSLLNISHTELRFKFKADARIALTPQEPGSDSTRELAGNDLMVSFNYMAPAGVDYNPLKGFNADLYGSVLQSFSSQDEFKNRFTLKKINMYEVTLDTTPEQSASILKKALEMSSKAQYSIPYDTWSSNCTTYLFDILDAGMGFKRQTPYRFKPWMVNDTGMIPALYALNERGLIHDQTVLRLLNSEFGYPRFDSDSNRYYGYWINKSFGQIKAQQAPQPIYNKTF